MTLAEVIEQQLHELLANADPAWLDAPPQVTEERVYHEWDTFTHQMYTCESRTWQAQQQRQAMLLFPEQFPVPKSPTFKEFMQGMDLEFDDGSPS